MSQQKEEMGALRLKLSEQEEALRDAKERLRGSNLNQDNMETFIVSQCESPCPAPHGSPTSLEVHTCSSHSLILSFPHHAYPGSARPKGSVFILFIEMICLDLMSDSRVKRWSIALY